MSWIVAGIAASTLYGAYKGYQSGEAAKEGRAAAGDIYEQRLGLLGEQKDISQQANIAQYGRASAQYGIAGQEYGLAYKQLGLAGERQTQAGQAADITYAGAESQFRGGMQDLSLGARSGLRGIQEGAPRTGLVSGGAERQSRISTSELMRKYQSSTQQLFAGREQAGKQRDLSKRAAGTTYKGAQLGYEAAGLDMASARTDYAYAGEQKRLSSKEIELAFKEGKMSAEEREEAMKASFGDTNWLEGGIEALLGSV